MKSLYIKLIFLFFILFCICSNSNSEETVIGYWTGIFPHYFIDDNQNISLQAEYRQLESDPSGLIRPFYQYKIYDEDGFSTRLGLGYDLFILEEEDEQRVWPEIWSNYKSESLGQNFDIRLRHEVRDLESESSVGFRTRLMLASNFVISEEYNLKGTFFDEIFWVNKDFAGRKNRIDRNWLGYRFRKGSDKLYYDLGAFWEYIDLPSESNIFIIFSVGARI